MKKNTFKVLFYTRGNRINKDGNVSVMIRITVDDKMEQLNSKPVVSPDIWDARTGRAVGRSAKVLELNSRLNDIQVILKEHYYDLQRRHGYVTAEMVRNAFTGICQSEESLLNPYEQHLEDTKKLVGLARPRRSMPVSPTIKSAETWRHCRRISGNSISKLNIP